MKVLAIGAHVDDIELGCGGSLVKHVKNKDKVCMYVITISISLMTKLGWGPKVEIKEES